MIFVICLYAENVPICNTGKFHSVCWKASSINLAAIQKQVKAIKKALK